jgi:hypothetical protein
MLAEGPSSTSWSAACRRDRIRSRPGPGRADNGNDEGGDASR